MHAAKHSNDARTIEAMQVLVNAGASLNLQNSKGISALVYAAC